MRSGKLEHCLRRSCPDTGPHGANWAPARKLPTFSSGGAVLQRETHQAGYHIVEPDQFRRAVWAFDAKENFFGVCVVMDAEIERALPSDLHFLRDVEATSREGPTR